MYDPNQHSYDSMTSMYLSHHESEASMQHDHASGLLGALKREATALRAYYLLLEKLYHENERNKVLAMIHEKHYRIQRLTEAYVSLTGLQPVYHHDQLVYENLNDGLQGLKEFEMETLEYYRYYYTRAQYPFIKEMYFHFLQGGYHNDMRDIGEGRQEATSLIDHGPSPYIVNIRRMTNKNENYRLALWTGNHLQLTLMSIPVNGDIGVEVHPYLDQFLRIEQGEGVVQMGEAVDKFDIEKKVKQDDIVIIPAGKWHNLINTGARELKLYSIYAPVQHPHGTVHETKEIALAAEGEHDHY